MIYYPIPAIEFVFLCLLVVGIILQAWFLLARVRPLATYKPGDHQGQFNKPFSIIICAKNEAGNLEKHIPLIMAQDYEEFEVVVVNDCSEDESEMVLARLKDKYPRLYYTSIPVDRKFFHGKKLALTIGIKAARHEYLLLTDADCRPLGNKWLQEMANGFLRPGVEIVLGFSGFEFKKGFVNHLARYDVFYTAIQYLGFALAKKPYMGVGRNLAYKRELFFKNNGLKGHLHIPSGDDDLFVQDIATSKNTTVIIHQTAQTISSAPLNLEQWLNQKARHLSTSSFYKPGLKRELLLEPIGRLLFWSSTIVLIFFNTFALVTIGVIVLKLATQLVFWKLIANKLKLGNIYIALFWFEFIHPAMLAWAYSRNLFNSRKKKWK